MHHINQLKKLEPDLDLEEIAILNEGLEQLINETHGIYADYKFLVDVIDLINALSIKWSVYFSYNYKYKNHAFWANIKMLDMTLFNSAPITLEALWFSLKVNEPPLVDILDEKIRQIAYYLH